MLTLYLSQHIRYFPKINRLRFLRDEEHVVCHGLDAAKVVFFQNPEAVLFYYHPEVLDGVETDVLMFGVEMTV